MAYTKYSLTPADNNAAPPNGAPEGMLPSAVNDTMRDMMAQIRDVGDGIRGGTYTMTAPVITGGSINGTTVGAGTASTGAFTTLTASGVATFSAGTVSAPAITTSGDTNTGIFFPAADTIAFTEGGVESMRIDSSGRLFIGTTTGASTLNINNSPNNGNAARIGLMAIGSADNGSAYPQIGYNFSTTATSALTYTVTDTSSYIRFTGGGIQTFTAVSGTAGNTISFTQGPFLAVSGTSWTNGSSDVRQKKNFETSQGLAELLRIEPVKYHFLADDDNSPKRLGFKAQNLLPIIPEMVVEKSDLAVDGTPYLTITPDYLLPVLVKAIQEQQVMIETLTTRLNALEGK
jgi:hypothetical protein